MNDLIAVLHLTIPIVGLWVLIFVCARNYRIDALRERLFTLRQDLFDQAADGVIEFDHPAYTELRNLMNGMIRFAHKVSFSRLVVSIILDRISPSPLMGERNRRWRRSVDELASPQAKQMLLVMHQRLIVQVVRHIVTGSPVMMATLLIYGAMCATRDLLHGAVKTIVEAFAPRVPGIDLLEGQALDCA